VARSSARTPLSGDKAKVPALPRHTHPSALRRTLSAFATLALVGLGLGLGGAAANADPTFPIGGTISDTTGAGIGLLSLSLFDSTHTFVETQITGADGSYAFGSVADGTYTVETTSPTGYVAIHATATVADAAFVLNVTDPRYGTISGVLTAGASPLSGVTVKAVDTVTSAAYNADAASDAGGGYSITLPATTGGYTLYFTDSSSDRLAITSYSFGAGSSGGSGACRLDSGVANVAPLATVGAVGLNVVLNPDPVACSGATPAPTATPAHRNTQLAQTGSTVIATPTPTATPIPTPTTAPDTSATATVRAPNPVLTPTDSTRDMPAWGWLLVAAAVLAMLGGVGFTVVRHR
jgi:SdrD B-like domain